ncbi:hypothetical protein ACIBEJ_09005 [Nonomuraea sp. NPDC050790]|uniref:hypothetical protein n=1 Tax=Nonomuraea sp. NPDC050790 TaxID=3364371 RepID=UPI0037A3F902
MRARSAIEWIIDLLKRIVTVTLETMKGNRVMALLILEPLDEVDTLAPEGHDRRLRQLGWSPLRGVDELQLQRQWPAGLTGKAPEIGVVEIDRGTRRGPELVQPTFG